MRILVIGGTRFIGPHVVMCLHHIGHQVTVLHRGQTEADLPPGVKHIHCPMLSFDDRRALADLRDDLKQLALDVVLDMIPTTEQTARAVMSVFRGIARRVIAISSQDVYRAYGKLMGIESGPEELLPLTEDASLRQRLYPYRGESPRDPADPKRWLDDYDKILVERVVLSDPDLPGTVLRLPMVYGPGDSQHRLFEYLKRMDDNRPVIPLEEGWATWRWTRGYVENIAAAITLVVMDERSTGRTYNVGENDALSMFEWVSQIGQAAGWKGQVIVVSKSFLPAHLSSNGDPGQHLVVDTTRIRNDLGYDETISRDEALQRTVSWERMNPPKEIVPTMFDYAAEDAALAAWEQHNR